MKSVFRHNALKIGCAYAITGLTLATPLAGSTEPFKPDNPLNRPASIHWCPERTADQQYTATAEAGCTLLVGKEDRRRAEAVRKQAKDWTPIAIENIQNEASRFVREYSQFLDCCANDVQSLTKLDKLEAQSIEILIAIQQSGLINAAYASCLRNCRGFTTSEIIRSVAQARDDLGKLRNRLNRLADATATVRALDYIRAGQEQRRIQIEQEAIGKEFRYQDPPLSAPTGTEIEDTTLTHRIGSNILDTSLSSAFGPDIGYVVSPDSAQQAELAPRSGLDTEATSLPTRAGTALGGANTPAATLSSTTGFEIDTVQGPTGLSTTPTRVGPAIGDSSLNRQR